MRKARDPHKTCLRLGYHQDDPSQFYSTSNQRYYTKEAVNTRNKPNSGPGHNFKSKISKDHLVLGDFKVDYRTENQTNFVEYPDDEVVQSLNTGARIPDRGKGLLSFGQQEKYTSSYGQVYNQKGKTRDSDALGVFMESQEQALRTKQRQSVKNTDLFQQKNHDTGQQYKTSYKQDYISGKGRNSKSGNILVHGKSKDFITQNSPIRHQHPEQNGNKRIENLMDQQCQDFKTRAHKFRNILAFGDQTMGNGARKKRMSNFRENTPFATTFNNKRWDQGRYSMRDQGASDFQKNNFQKSHFKLGNFQADYRTMNKENYQGQQIGEKERVAGKKRRHESHVAAVFGHGDKLQKTEYEVFINQKGNKINVI